MNLTTFEFFKKLIRLPFISRIILYGSRARNDALERSDIDLAIDCPTASEQDWLTIVALIEDADTLLKIDYVRFDSLSEKNPLLQAIKLDGVVVYAKK